MRFLCVGWGEKRKESITSRKGKQGWEAGGIGGGISVFEGFSSHEPSNNVGKLEHHRRGVGMILSLPPTRGHHASPCHKGAGCHQTPSASPVRPALAWFCGAASLHGEEAWLAEGQDGVQKACAGAVLCSILSTRGSKGHGWGSSHPLLHLPLNRGGWEGKDS